MSTKYISQMFRHIKSNVFEDLNKISEEEPLQKIKGGNMIFNFIKKYLDMLFSKEKELKEEQKNSLQRLTEIREKEEEEKNQLEKDEEFQQDNNLLAQQQKKIEIARQKEFQIKLEADEKKQMFEQAQIVLEQVNQQVNLAHEEVKQSEIDNKNVYEEIQTRKKNAEIAENQMRQMYQQMQNKELVSLEESKEAQEDNAVIEEIEKLSLQNRLEIKHNDILY